MGSKKYAEFVRVLRGVLSCFRPRFKILAYHSVADVSHDPFEVEAEEFEKQMSLLSHAGCHVIELEQAILMIEKGAIQDKTVAITFDDGSTSLRRFAFPVLKKFQYPATVFISFDYVGGIDSFSYDDPRPDRGILDWADIEKSMEYAISYGSHGMSHRSLVELDIEELRKELNESRKILEYDLGFTFFPLAYPFGMFDNRVKHNARDSGYDCGLCFGNTLSNTRSTDIFEVKREKVLRSTSLCEFSKLIDVKYDFRRKVKYLLGRVRHRNVA